MIVKMIKDHTSGLHAAVETKNRLNNRLQASDDKEQESPADAGIPARRKNDEKNSSISKL